MRKSKVLLLVSFILLVSIGISILILPVSAKETSTDATRYSVIYSKRNSIEISGVQCTCNAEVRTNSATSLSIQMELQKLKSGVYETIKTWEASTTGVILALSENRLINVLATYRLKVTFTAGSETIVAYAYP